MFSDGLSLIKFFEGCKLTAYPDPATGCTPWTIGYGATVDKDDRPFKRGDTITQEQADALLIRDFNYIKNSPRIKQLKLPRIAEDALVSLVYNCGPKVYKWNMYKGIQEKDIKKVFTNWNAISANGKAMVGLCRRRAAELSMFFDGISLDRNESKMWK